jgi:K+-transporting ATPase ATPase A chain
MTLIGLLQLLVYMIVLFALVKPLGGYMARVYQGRPCGLDRLLGPLEGFLYKLCGIQATEEK